MSSGQQELGTSPAETPLGTIARLLGGPEIARLIGGSAAIYVLRVAGAACQLATQVLIARWLGPETQGEYLFAVALISTVSVFGALGLPYAALRFVPESLARDGGAAALGFRRFGERVIAGQSLAMGLLGAAAVFLLASDRAGYWLLALAAIPFAASLMFKEALGRAVGLFAAALVPTWFLRPFLVLGGVVIAVAAGWQPDAIGLLLLYLGIAATLAVAQHAAVVRGLARRIAAASPRYEIARWLKAGAPLMLAMGYAGWFMELNVLLAGASLPARDLAVFNIAYQVVNVAAFFLISVSHSFAPEASTLFALGKRDELQALLRRATLVRFSYAAFVFLVLAAAGPFVLGLFGPAYREGYAVLVILAGIPLVTAAAGPLTHLLSLAGQERPATVVSALGLGFNAVLVLVLTPACGVMGAAAGALIATVALNAGFVLVAWRALGLNATVFGRPRRAGAAGSGGDNVQ